MKFTPSLKPLLLVAVLVGVAYVCYHSSSPKDMPRSRQASVAALRPAVPSSTIAPPAKAPDAYQATIAPAAAAHDAPDASPAQNPPTIPDAGDISAGALPPVAAVKQARHVGRSEMELLG